MARKPLLNNETSPLGGPNSKNDGFYRAGLASVGSDGTVEFFSDFLLNPESIEDNKTSNWHAHSIPGQESPVYQWVNGGPRVVSFEALVTKDTINILKKETDPLEMLKGAVVNAIGSIASSLAGVNIPLAGLLNKPSIPPGSELSISDKLEFYRSLYKPKYSQNGQLEGSPPLVILYLGDSLSDKEIPTDEITKNTQLWMMTSLNIKITKWLPNLAPMEATVNFQFTQYQITSIPAQG